MKLAAPYCSPIVLQKGEWRVLAGRKSNEELDWMGDSRLFRVARAGSQSLAQQMSLCTGAWDQDKA